MRRLEFRFRCEGSDERGLQRETVVPQKIIEYLEGWGRRWSLSMRKNKRGGELENELCLNLINLDRGREFEHGPPSSVQILFSGTGLVKDSLDNYFASRYTKPLHAATPYEAILTDIYRLLYQQPHPHNCNHERRRRQSQEDPRGW